MIKSYEVFNKTNNTMLMRNNNEKIIIKIMKKNNERYILSIIKWAPMLFIVVLSIIATYLKIIDNEMILQNRLNIVKDEFLQRNNNKIISEVNSIITYIKYQKRISENELKKILKKRTYQAHSLANNIYKENKNKNKKELEKLIKDALRDLRFNDNRGYYLLTSKMGHAILHPLKRDAEGKIFSHLKDSNGFYFIKKIMEIIEDKEEAFSSYYLRKFDSKSSTLHKKVMFSKYFEPLDIAISASDYVSDFEKTTKENVLDYINNLALNEGSYFFIFDNEGKLLAHLKKKYLNVKLENLPKEFKNTLSMIIKELKNNKNIIKYKNSFGKDSIYFNNEKTSYIKIFEPWKWNIGKGYYDIKLEKLIKEKKDTFIKKSQEQLNIIIMISVISTTLLLLLSFYLSNLVKKRFILYKRDLLNEIDKNKEKESLLAQQSKMAAMGEMIANIAHQWRQPLSVISTASSGLKVKKEFSNLTDKDFYFALETIDTSLTYLSKTINDFTNFFKTDKTQTLTTSNKIIHNLHSLIKVQFEQDNIKFVLDIKEVKLSILDNELLQVLLNVFNNSKEQLLLCKIEEATIFVEMYEKDEHLYIKIKDNANGIKENVLNRIYEPYFTTKHKSQGTGIGLYMCAEIVKRSLKGTISSKNCTFEDKGVVNKGLLTTIIIPKNLP